MVKANKDRPSPIFGQGQAFYEVEKVRCYRSHPDRWCVRWMGWSKKYDSWITSLPPFFSELPDSWEPGWK
jgi:hypothetical protein